MALSRERRKSVKLPVGKVPSKTLENVVFTHLGAKRSDVVIGPGTGLDGAVVDVGDKSLITSIDPITGALERIGWLAVNINANDVATFGVRPAYFSSCILLPENSYEKTVKEICTQIDLGARQIGLAVIGGHSEITPRLPFPIVVGCCMGISEKGRYVTSQNAEAGNRLILTKSVGIEGTAILSSDRFSQLSRSISKETLERAQDLSKSISIVEEAILAYNTGHVTAMHDPTEGGVAGGIHELCDASNLGFKVLEERLSISEETLQVCNFFGIDPLQLVASGSLLISVDDHHADDVMDMLTKNQIAANIIGELHRSPRKRQIVRKDGTIEALPRPQSDHLWQALKQ
jgi:hydrogenase expression/formation protein HypE